MLWFSLLLKIWSCPENRISVALGSWRFIFILDILMHQPSRGTTICCGTGKAALGFHWNSGRKCMGRCWIMFIYTDVIIFCIIFTLCMFLIFWINLIDVLFILFSNISIWLIIAGQVAAAEGSSAEEPRKHARFHVSCFTTFPEVGVWSVRSCTLGRELKIGDPIHSRCFRVCELVVMEHFGMPLRLQMIERSSPQHWDGLNR